MRVKRLQITLPAHLRHTATHDARAIAEAVGRAIHQNGGHAESVEIQGHNLTGPVLAQEVGMRISNSKGGTRNGR